MPQQFVLYPDLTVTRERRLRGEPVRPPLFGAAVGGSSRCSSSSDLWAVRGRRAGELSGGMQRRLELACALVHEPAPAHPRRAHRGRRPAPPPDDLGRAPPPPGRWRHRPRHDPVRHRGRGVRRGGADRRGLPDRAGATRTGCDAGRSAARSSSSRRRTRSTRRSWRSEPAGRRDPADRPPRLPGRRSTTPASAARHRRSGRPRPAARSSRSARTVRPSRRSSELVERIGGSCRGSSGPRDTAPRRGVRPLPGPGPDAMPAPAAPLDPSAPRGRRAGGGDSWA